MLYSNNTNDKLWNKNFFLLWQGQLVSVLGDVIYMIALDFWILEMTGSTALMGLLSALTMIPKIILGPFAGVFVDKWDRKKIIVISDLIRGIFVTFVGIVALNGFIEVWMVFVVGILNGLCSTFFNPAIVSSRPDIVHPSKLVKANSVTSLAQSSMNMIGSAIGGVLYVTIGAPYMFLFNGISYLFSAFTELFISIPSVERQDHKVTFTDDFRIGLNFLKNFKLLRNIFINSSLINFFSTSSFILLVAYFKETPFLGTSRYGFAMTVLSLGAMSGSILLSVINIRRENKFRIYSLLMVVQCLLLVGIMVTDNYYLMLIFIFIAFLCNACCGTISTTAIMAVIPSDIRGKVMSIIFTTTMCLMPIGKLIGGILGEIFPIRIVMISLFLCCFVCGIVHIRIKNIRDFIEFDSSIDEINSLMEC